MAVVLLLFLAISAFIFLKADSPDTETTVYYLAVAVILWAVLCFLYVFIRDAVIALRWKKPAFPLSQYEKEDVEIDCISDIFQRLPGYQYHSNRLFFPPEGE